jgi:hypothetical protein
MRGESVNKGLPRWRLVEAGSVVGYSDAGGGACSRWLAALQGGGRLDANHAREAKRVSCVTLQRPVACNDGDAKERGTRAGKHAA